MIYYLHELTPYFGPLRVFEYLSVRTMGGAGTSFILVMLFGPFLIRMLHRLRVGQHVRDDEVLETHRKKEGTPTMGGVLIIAAVVISTVLWARPTSMYVWLTLATLVWMGGIGFYDDYLKVVKRRSQGLSARGKLVLQSGWLIVVLFVLRHSDVWETTRQLMVPFFKEPVVGDLTFLGTFVFMYLVLVGTCNAVNLTDGLDGLATGCSNSAFVAYLVMAYATGNVIWAEYLQISYIAYAGELSVFCGCMLGAGLGFLWYNCYPAKVFMGDTGSLAIGGSMAMVAILVKQELTLLIVGGVFVMEAASVVLQVGRFKLTGKRFFRCAPIHHHFELIAKDRAIAEGKSADSIENLVVTRFWILSIIFAILGIATLKIR